jgi:hypothetical protein
MSEWTPKNPRIREVPGNKTGRVKKITEVYLVPGAAHADEPNYRCPAGPGLRDVPADGQWYALTVYLRRRCQTGELDEGAPPAEKKAKPKKPAEKKAEEK